MSRQEVDLFVSFLIFISSVVETCLKTHTQAPTISVNTERKTFCVCNLK